MNGKIIVYTGPMFSSKSAMLLLFAYERSLIAGKKIVALKPKIDNRFGDTYITSRTFGKIAAKNISNISELKNYDADVYIIDEFQFLEGDIFIIQEMANCGKIFHISGLDMTAEGKPFGLMPELLAIADKVNKEIAICEDCKEDNAIYSFYLGEKDEDILVGNKEYIALCRNCWRKRMEAKKRGIIWVVLN